MATKTTPLKKKALSAYRTKRDFEATPEPLGTKKAPSMTHAYVIQKHAARRLHYDLRLEMDGTLKSWAVTKGPSLNPDDKRLAVHVEDHPLDYGGFEGVIPQGQYGGGAVMLWDQGTWTAIGDAKRGYAKGHLNFELNGKRLKGRWHLVRMKGKIKGDEKHDNWLLIKGKDEYANHENGDVALERYQKSVVSKRSFKQILKDGNAFAPHAPTASSPRKRGSISPKTQISSRARTNMAKPPDFIPPELATLVDKPPRGNDWVHEIKFDGYRLQAHLLNGKVQLITRGNKDWTAKFTAIAKDLQTLELTNGILDGEVVSISDDGTMSFHGLQEALHIGDQNRLHYYIFDLLFLDGERLTGLPLAERKERLKNLLTAPPTSLHFSDHLEGPGDKMLQHACQMTLEGIVSKRLSKPYFSGRNEYWVKAKCLKKQELVVGGFTTQPKHPGSLGALLMGYYDKDDFIYAGKVGTGFSQSEGALILKRLRKMAQKTAPFKSVSTAVRRGATWVEPTLVAQVHFFEWTHDGSMRHPSFQGLREDKPAREVGLEKPKPTPSAKDDPTADPSKIGGKRETIAGISLSHPDKRLYPGATITKRELAAYYEKVAPLMLPHVAGRPISLLRCPNGEGKPCFFQRHGIDMFTTNVKPVKVSGETEPYLMIEDVEGLISLVQMNALEIHIWNAMADDVTKPDQFVFDLDPAPDVAFEEVKKAAVDIRENLKKLKLTSFLKTTGGKGLHVVVPIERGPNWDEVKTFTRLFAETMVKVAPDRFTSNIRKKARTGKIYLDYLRNAETASAIAPYSTRAKPGAPVAMPLAWKDIAALKGPQDFNVENVMKLRRQDPWKDIRKLKQKLPK